MFGLGLQELLIFFVIAGFLMLPVVVIVAVVLYVQRAQNGPLSDNPNLIRCSDCGGTVSRLAVACPHCGRPMSPADYDLS